MDKPNLHEMLSAAREVPDSMRLAAARLINRLCEPMDEAQNVWGQEVDEEVEQE